MSARVSAQAKLAGGRGFRDRRTGAFGTPDEDTAEPQRTERLLAEPYVLFRKRAADMQHAVSMTLLASSSGHRLTGLMWQLSVRPITSRLGMAQRPRHVALHLVRTV